MESLFPEGDPGNGIAVSGFWNSREIPKSLAAVDAVFWAAASLLREGAPSGAEWLAFWLLDRFAASTRATFFFLSTCPVEADLLLREMTSRNLVPPRGVGGSGVFSGSNPLRCRSGVWFPPRPPWGAGWFFSTDSAAPPQAVPLPGTGEGTALQFWRATGLACSFLCGEARRLFRFFSR